MAKKTLTTNEASQALTTQTGFDICSEDLTAMIRSGGVSPSKGDNNRYAWTTADLKKARTVITKNSARFRAALCL